MTERTRAEAKSEVEARIAEALRDRDLELDLSGLGLTAVPELVSQLAQLQSLVNL